MAVRWFRYVPYRLIPDYMALGWDWDDQAPPLHAPHGVYSVVMEYKRDGEPVEPKREGEDDEIQRGCLSSVPGAQAPR
jgi:hypothetical protein